jgi:hypothetical protein
MERRNLDASLVGPLTMAAENPAARAMHTSRSLGFAPALALALPAKRPKAD